MWRFLKNGRIKLIYALATPLLGIYPEKTTLLKDTCSPVFIAALFTVARIWNQLRCPLTDEWIKKKKKPCGTYMQWNIAQRFKKKKKRTDFGLVKQMKLESVMPSEISQKGERQISYINTHI